MNKTFYENYMIIKSCFPGEYSIRHALGAFLCMVNDPKNREIIKKERVLQCKKILNTRINLSASFRDNLKLPLVIKMALSEDPERYLSGVVETFNSIKETYFTGSGQKFITALAIYDNCPDELIRQYCDKMYDIYGKMKEEHPLLTGQEDMLFAALLAIDDEAHTNVVDEMETCFDILKQRFRIGLNAIQNVSHVLSLTDIAPKEKSAKFVELYERLKDNKSRTGVGPQLIVLAVLSILDLSVEECVTLVRGTDEYLKELKGFGTLGVRPQFRRMIAVALAAAEHLPADDVVIHDVRGSLLRTILSTAMIGGMLLTRSALEMSAHR